MLLVLKAGALIARTLHCSTESVGRKLQVLFRQLKLIATVSLDYPRIIKRVLFTENALRSQLKQLFPMTTIDLVYRTRYPPTSNYPISRRIPPNITKRKRTRRSHSEYSSQTYHVVTYNKVITII